MKKKLSLMLCLCIMALTLAACGSADPQDVDYGGMSYSDLQSSAQNLVTSIAASSEEELSAAIETNEQYAKQYAKQYGREYTEAEAVISLLQSWLDTTSDVGTFVGLGEFSIDKTSDTVTVDQIVNFSERDVASRFGYWKDTGIRLEGEAVWSMTVMFLEMWNYINHSSEDYKQFMPQVYQKEPFEGDGFVQPYGDTPLDHETVGENIYLNIINHAERYVYIFTPYLIIDNEMLVSLCNAAKRGVDVRIVTPGIPDKKMIFLLTQSHYEPLLKCGVKIYQYTPGFIHAKSFLCDDKIGTVGSINLDYRSLFLHFECGVFMYKTKALMQLKEDCMDTFAASEEMTLEFCRGQNVFIRIFQGMMRLFAPLL